MGLCSVKWCQGQSVNDEVGVKWVACPVVLEWWAAADLLVSRSAGP